MLGATLFPRNHNYSECAIPYEGKRKEHAGPLTGRGVARTGCTRLWLAGARPAMQEGQKQVFL